MEKSFGFGNGKICLDLWRNLLDLWRNLLDLVMDMQFVGDEPMFSFCFGLQLILLGSFGSAGVLLWVGDGAAFISLL